MSVEVRLARIAEFMDSARISVWLKSEGDPVEAGEVIAEVETDKAIVEVVSPVAGRLFKIHVAAGSVDVSPGVLLAEIQDGAGRLAVNAEVTLASTEESSSGHPVTGSNNEGLDERLRLGGDEPALEFPPSRNSVHADVAATPLARQMANVLGLDLRSIPGSGPNGRINKQDVERVQGQPPAGRVAVASMEAPPAPGTTAPFVERPLSAIRRITATRLTAAKQTVPHFYLQIDCAMDALLDLRQRFNTSGSGRKLSVTDFVVRAAALALRKVPTANSSVSNDSLKVFTACDVAVAVNTSHGVMTPIVRQADQKGLFAIAAELGALVEEARAGKLSLNDYSGGTFTVSNLGMHGVTSLYAIVNPPQSCVLGVGAIQQRAVVRNQQVVIGHEMSCTLSADHRAIDGATGAEFLAQFKCVMEDPVLLLT